MVDGLVEACRKATTGLSACDASRLNSPSGESGHSMRDEGRQSVHQETGHMWLRPSGIMLASLRKSAKRRCPLGRGEADLPAGRGTAARQGAHRGRRRETAVDLILSCYMSPDLPSARRGSQAAGYASRTVSCSTSRAGAGTARGRGAHHPVVAGAHFVTQLESIVSRNVKPTDAAVVTVGRFSAGNAANVILDTASWREASELSPGGLRDGRRRIGQLSLSL